MFKSEWLRLKSIGKSPKLSLVIRKLNWVCEAVAVVRV